MSKQLLKTLSIGHVTRGPQDSMAFGNGVGSKVQPKGGSTTTALNGEVDFKAGLINAVTFHNLPLWSSVNEGCDGHGWAIAMTPICLHGP